MKVSGHSMNHSYSRQARTFLDDSQLIHESGVPCVGDVYVTQTFIEYGTETECYRPKIVLAGRLLNLKGQFPENIQTIDFEEADQPDVILYYELSNRQIAKMYADNIFPDKDQLAKFVADKEEGLISHPETIMTPDIMNMNTYEDLPMTCSYLMVKDSDVPIIFVQPDTQYNISLDETCGYELTDYLEPFKEAEVQKEQFEDFVDDEFFQEEEQEEQIVQEPEEKRELTEGEKVGQDIFSITKPRVDEHIDKDNAHIDEVNKIVEDIDLDDDENDSEEYASYFERMMREGLSEGEAENDTSVDNTESDEKAEPLADGPLSIKKILERKNRQNQKTQTAVHQNEELNKTMPANLENIQSNMNSEDNKQAGD
jgi:hypothetical protein